MEEEFMKLELEQKWEQHYDLLTMKSRRHSSNVADTSLNASLNRYMDVKPYDKSRVVLSRTPDFDYINANIVTVPKAARQYILTQGPLPKTLSHFWLMVWEQKSSVIVMLNKIYEMEDFAKCAQYWPDELGQTKVHNDVRLSVTLVTVRTDKHYTTRELMVRDLDTERSRIVIQFHYTAWPDHGEPDSPTSILRVLAAVRKSGGLDRMDEPAVIHCSAGIGRSGTFCLIDSILCMVENQGSTEGIDIDNTLLEMRDYRMGLIQSPVQLKFAYMSIIYGVKILQKANKLHSHISSVTESVAFNFPSFKQSVEPTEAQQAPELEQARRFEMAQQFEQPQLPQQMEQLQLSHPSEAYRDSTRMEEALPQNPTPVPMDDVSNQNTTPVIKLNQKKASRRQRKKVSSSSVTTLNVFQKNILVEALDNIESDEADSLFYNTMRPLPDLKKPRNSSPEELSDEYSSASRQIPRFPLSTPPKVQSSPTLSWSSSSSSSSSQPPSSTASRAQRLDFAIQSMLSENAIPTLIDKAAIPPAPGSPPRLDSILMRRREKEAKKERDARKSQEMAERVQMMKTKMREQQERKDRWIYLRKFFVGGSVATVLITSLIYMYSNGYK